MSVNPEHQDTWPLCELRLRLGAPHLPLRQASEIGSRAVTDKLGYGSTESEYSMLPSTQLLSARGISYGNLGGSLLLLGREC